jgi:hypothetical protein
MVGDQYVRLSDVCVCVCVNEQNIEAHLSEHKIHLLRPCLQNLKQTRLSRNGNHMLERNFVVVKAVCYKPEGRGFEIR